MAKDYYSALGVSRDASLDDIRKAYRKLARKCHPDVNPGDRKSEERFKEIAAAYDVLGDEERRKLYDEFGEEGIKAGFDPEKARAYRQWQSRSAATGGFGGRPGFQGAAEAGFDLGDIFADLRGFKAERSAAPGRGADIESRLSIPLRDAVLGAETELSLERPSPCSVCHGEGTRPGSTSSACGECGGSGSRQVSQGPIAFRTTCSRCGGTGRSAGPPCDACGGSGQVPGTSRLRVKIPSGIEDGQTIRLAGQGMPGRRGGPAGDLLIVVSIAPHRWVRRDGRDLLMEFPVTVAEALVGAEVVVPTFEGSIQMKIPSGSQTGTKLRLKGKGAGRTGSRGDLYVVLKTVVPDQRPLSDAARDAAQDLDKHYGRDVRADLRL